MHVTRVRILKMINDAEINDKEIPLQRLRDLVTFSWALPSVRDVVAVSGHVDFAENGTEVVWNLVVVKQRALQTTQLHSLWACDMDNKRFICFVIADKYVV